MSERVLRLMRLLALGLPVVLDAQGTTGRARRSTGERPTSATSQPARSADAPDAAKPPRAAAPPAAAFRVRVAPGADSIVFLIEGRLPDDGAVRVSRRSGDTVLHLDPPLRAERDPVRALQVLGPDIRRLQRLTRADRELDALRRLLVDPEVTTILSAISPTIGRIAGRRWADTAVVSGATYQYLLQAVDRRDSTVGPAISVSVIASAVSVPPPNTPTVTRDGKTARVGWSYPPDGPTSSTVTGFLVRRVSDSVTTHLLDDPLPRRQAKQFAVTDPEPMVGRPVRYEVLAVDLAGNVSRPVSTEEFVVRDREAPKPPQGPAVREENDAVQLAWAISPEPDVVGYRVERAIGAAERFSPIGPSLIPRDSPEFRDATATAGAQYFYRIVAVDRAGLVSEPTTSLAAVPVDRIAPDSARGLAVAVDAGAITLRWQPSPSSDVRGYAVYRGEVGFPTIRLTPTSAPGLLFVDSVARRTGPQPGRRYVYEVAAVDRVGNESVRLRTVGGVADRSPPGAVRSMRATIRPDGAAEIAWSATGDLDVEAYRVTRGGIELATVAASATLRVVDTLVVGADGVEFEVRAVDRAGNLGPPMRERVRPTDRTPPSPPRDARVRRLPTGVEVTWERVVDDALAGYVVYRALPGASRLVRLTPRPITDTRYTDSGGRPGAHYVIRASDVTGNESQPSPRAIVPSAGPGGMP